MIRSRLCPALLALLASHTAIAINDGLLDPSFGSIGYAYIGVDAGGVKRDLAHAIALQPDGKVLMLGTASTTQLGELYLTRYKADGSIDAGFGTSGQVEYPDLYPFAAAVGVAPDGKIITASYFLTISGHYCWRLARFSSAGLPDGGFVNGGSYSICPGTAPVPSGGDLKSAALAIAPDGSFFVGGTYNDGTHGDDFYVMKFAASNGALDTLWGNQGATRIPFDTGGSKDDTLKAMLLQGDGKLVLAGSVAVSATDTDTALVRLSTTGGYDPAFYNGAGRTTIGYNLNGTGRDGAVAIAATSGGKYIVLDDVRDVTAARDVMGVMRINPDGTLDTSFGTGGKSDIIGFGFVDDSTITPLGLVVQGNRRIVALARYAKGSGNTLDAKFAFQRLRPAGTVDTSFNPGPFSTGAVMHDLRSAAPHADQVPAALAINGAGIYFAGSVQYVTSNADDYDMVLGRLANDLIFANDFD